MVRHRGQQGRERKTKRAEKQSFSTPERVAEETGEQSPGNAADDRTGPGSPLLPIAQGKIDLQILIRPKPYF